MSRPVIVNQVGDDIGRRIAALPSSPVVIDCPEPARPWEISREAEILVTRAWPGWAEAPAAALALPRLRWIQTYSAGTEIYPEWLKVGRTVTTGRGLTAPQIAEYVLAAMLSYEKGLHRHAVDRPEAWRQQSLGTLQGKVLGLIGFGAIGREVASRASAFGMHIMACRRQAVTAREGNVELCDAPEDVASMADHLVLAAPLTPCTRGMIGAEMLSRLRPGAHLINVSRGGLIDQDALLAGLAVGQPGFATLDVTEPEPLPASHPLWRHPRVLLTPHVSYTGGPEAERFVDKFAWNLAAYLDGRPLRDRFEPGRGY